jgi:hypothetical protein
MIEQVAAYTAGHYRHEPSRKPSLKGGAAKAEEKRREEKRREEENRQA